ncbi:hypothetical protein [Phenylobacterium sp.]|uniref:hypothetical protein n=1 Tax=Phenylobacterium sp. TaxID=1871053 RepID=UPI002ED7AFB5
MWRTRPPTLLLFALFVGLGPLVGALAAYLQMPAEARTGTDDPREVASIMLWGAYVVGLAPALATGIAATLAWLTRRGPVAYVLICCIVGATSAAAMVVPLVALGTLESTGEIRGLTIYMATCGAVAALPPALATLPRRLALQV